MTNTIESLNQTICSCSLCPRLVQWRRQVAQEKRRQFQDETYWGKAVAGFGDPKAKILIVGLAPAAHGANRTGRMFTGDRSGQWLYRALYKAGLAKHQGYESRDDGQELYSCYITAAVHCAPPENKPSLEEKQQCLTYLRQELRLLSQVSVIIALGAMAWDQILKVYFEQYERIRPKPTFSHGAQIELRPYTLIGSYHPSQQNTFTGKLREEMFDKIFRQARADIEKKT